MRDGLVSIISSCYNKEPYLERFIQSIVDQDYRPIELIVVDDGSTDGSWRAIHAMENKCKDADISTVFLHQENMGVGYAINSCLAKVQGEFLCWPDCDDWLENTSVSKRVQFLQANKRYGIVTSNASIYREPDKKVAVGLISTDRTRFQERQYELLLNGKSIVCPGCHMVRTKSLFSAMGTNQIFPSRYGQNLQILFPILYHSPRGFIDQPLYNYVIYESSLSHYQRSFEKQWEHREGRYQIKKTTIMNIAGITESDLKRSLKTISVNEARYRLELAAKYGKRDIAREQISSLLSQKALGLCDLMIFLTMRKQ